MTFLFDIGRVLLDFNFAPSLKTLFAADDEESAARLGRILERKDEFEAGLMDVPTYTDWALDILGTETSADEFLAAWRNIFTPNFPMWQRVRELREQGHRLILFSNTSAAHCPWIFEEFPEFALFDDAVLSFNTGMVKPQRGIYEYAISHHSLIPAETAYIDDLEPNIRMGEHFGFICWQYDLHHHGAFDEWIDALLESK